MRYGLRTRAVLLVMLAALGVTGVGCVEWLAASNLYSFVAGWELRGLTLPVTTERQCFQNGVEVDCATLPANLGQ